MNQENEPTFRDLQSDILTPAGLKGLVLASISTYEYRKRWAQFIGSGILAAASIIAVIPAFSYVSTSFESSNFYQYFYVLVSDTGFITEYWADLLMSLVESIPLTSGVFFLLVLTLIVWSSKKLLIALDKLMDSRRKLRLIK